MWEDNYAYANDDGTNSYMDSDPMVAGDYEYTPDNSDFFGNSDLYGSLVSDDPNAMYQSDYFDLASQLADSGYIPTDDYGNPELSALLGNTDLAGAESFGDLSAGQLAGIAPWAEAGDYATAMALQDAEMAGAGLTPMMGNPGYYLDPNGNPVYAGDLQSGAVGNSQVAAPTFQTSESVVGGVAPVVDNRKEEFYSDYGGIPRVLDNGDGTFTPTDAEQQSLWRGLQERPMMSRPNTVANDLISQGSYPHSELGSDGETVVVAQGQYSAPYDISDPKSFEDAARLIEYQAQEGTDRYDPRSMLQKGLSGALNMLKRDPQAAQTSQQRTGGAGGQQSQNGGGAGGAPMALTSALLQALGAMQNKGKAPTPTGGSQNAQAMRISRKAGSGRQNKASGGLLQMANGGRAAGGQDDVIPINAAPGEYVMDAETVSALGDGSTEAGAAKLDQMRHNVRQHKRTGALSKIPPKAKSVDKYMKGAR